MWYLISGIIGLVGGGVISHILRLQSMKHASAQEMATIDKKTEAEITTLMEDATTDVKHLRASMDEDKAANDEHLQVFKELINNKESIYNRKRTRNNHLFNVIKKHKNAITDYKASMEELQTKMFVALEMKSQSERETIKNMLTKDYYSDIVKDKELVVRKQEELINDDVHKTATCLIQYVMQRYSGPSSVEQHSLNITVPREIIKGMLVGRGGTNIRYIESLFPGLQFIFNYEPKTIHIAGFNLLHKNIAHRTLKLLTRKKAISHETIQQCYEKSKRYFDNDMMERGRKTMRLLGIKDVPDRLLWLTGRLYYRTSYRQNVLKHSIEMAFFAEMMASEIGSDSYEAKVATFFHDIGKAIDHDIETEEGHDYITKRILEEHNYDPEIVHAAFVHHDAEPSRNVSAWIVKAADAISGGRPGARQESLTSYVERIKALEDLAKDQPGIEKSYALSAGREIRLLVKAKEIGDDQLDAIAEKTAERIEDNLTYPGRIKVTVIRSVKHTMTAK